MAEPTSVRFSWPVRVLWLAAALAVVQVISLLAWYWPGAMPDTLTSGVWIALADDVAHGDFYRPLHSALGTGGTRYMPLFFLLHGGLIKLGVAPLSAGVLLTLGSAGALVAASALLLRQLEIPRSIAWPAALLVLGAVSFEMMLLTVKGDFLAAALNLGGVALALAARRMGGRGLLIGSAALFAAAFLTKITTLFGLGALTAWLLGRREWRIAVSLSAFSGILIAIGVGLSVWASDGRMVESFRAVAGGDTNLAFALTAPTRFVAECAGDPLALVLFLGLIGCVFFLWRTSAGALPILLILSTFSVTLVIFGSPGTGANHLIDPLVTAVIALACVLKQSGSGRAWAGLTAGAFGLGIVIAWLPGVPSIRSFFTQHHRPEIAAVQEFTARAGGAVAHPIFSENPLIPIIAGQRPFAADLFNLELMLRHDAALRSEMLGRFRAGEFGSVVLANWPGIFLRDVDSPDDPLIAATLPRLRATLRVAEGFHEALETRYRIVLVRRPYIYWLRTDLPFAPSR